MEVETSVEKLRGDTNKRRDIQVEADEMLVPHEIALLPKQAFDLIVMCNGPPSVPATPHLMRQQTMRLILVLPHVPVMWYVHSPSTPWRSDVLIESNFSTTPGVAYHCLVLGTVQVCHHSRTHQEVGLHLEPKLWDVKYLSGQNGQHREDSRKLEKDKLCALYRKRPPIGCRHHREQ